MADFSDVPTAAELEDDEPVGFEDVNDLPPEWENDAPENQPWDMEDREEDYIPLTQTASGSNVTLDDPAPLPNRPNKRARVDDTSTVTDKHPTAGKIIGQKKDDGSRWAEGQDTEGVNIFHPFVSELDWRVAKWFVDDGPGKSAIDRLMKIDGVSNISALQHLY